LQLRQRKIREENQERGKDGPMGVRRGRKASQKCEVALKAKG
jgi:hypothetical protein